jgi:hypothetical protein
MFSCALTRDGDVYGFGRHQVSVVVRVIWFVLDVVCCGVFTVAQAASNTPSARADAVPRALLADESVVDVAIGLGGEVGRGCIHDNRYVGG